MTKEEQVVGLIFQVTMWAYIAAAAAYVVIGWRQWSLRALLPAQQSNLSRHRTRLIPHSCSYGCSPCLFEKVRPRFPERKPRRATGL